MPSPTTTISAGDLQQLADRLTFRGASLADLQGECRTASKAIRALLRHTATSDVFTITGDDTKPETEGRTGLPEASPVIVSSSHTHIMIAIEVSRATLARSRRFLEMLLAAAEIPEN
jgi:hypothetical protein